MELAYAGAFDAALGLLATGEAAGSLDQFQRARWGCCAATSPSPRASSATLPGYY